LLHLNSWLLQNGDVGFAVLGAEPCKWSTLTRVNAHEQILHGHVLARESRVSLEWCNEHSWFSGKQVFFAVAI
jgi:hypothetical protein